MQNYALWNIMHDAIKCMNYYYAKCNIMHAINVMNIINATEEYCRVNSTIAIAARRNLAIFTITLLGQEVHSRSRKQ